MPTYLLHDTTGEDLRLMDAAEARRRWRSDTVQHTDIRVGSSAMFGFAARTKAVTRRIQSLAQLNIELAKAEGKQKATALGMAGALGAVAAVLVIYAIGFAFATAAAGLSEALPLWLSLLIVTGVILVLAAVAGLLARQSARKASPAKPSQAIEEAQQTVEALRSHV